MEKPKESSLVSNKIASPEPGHSTQVRLIYFILAYPGMEAFSIKVRIIRSAHLRPSCQNGGRPALSSEALRGCYWEHLRCLIHEMLCSLDSCPPLSYAEYKVQSKIVSPSVILLQAAASAMRLFENEAGALVGLRHGRKSKAGFQCLVDVQPFSIGT